MRLNFQPLRSLCTCPHTLTSSAPSVFKHQTIRSDRLKEGQLGEAEALKQNFICIFTLLHYVVKKAVEVHCHLIARCFVHAKHFTTTAGLTTAPSDVVRASLHMQNNAWVPVTFFSRYITQLLQHFILVGILFVSLPSSIQLHSTLSGTYAYFAYCTILRVLSGAYICQNTR